MPELRVGKQTLQYEIRRHKLARHMRIRVRANGTVWITVPPRARAAEIEELICTHVSWIDRQRALMQERSGGLPENTPEHYRKHKEWALRALQSRVAYFNQWYEASYRAVQVRNQRTRWGSCSAKKTLTFNYRTAFLPAHLADYIVVHELSHLQELNHSPTFWRLVAYSQPHYKQLHEELTTYAL